jgi:membrane protein YqaA with SNARE-associated domain
MNPQRRQLILRVFILAMVIGLSVFLYTIRDQLVGLEKYGYPGIFLISILANATVIIPLPGIVITSAMGAVFNPLGVAIAAGCGAALGEISGYLAGFSGQAVIERRDWHEKFVNWMQKYGDITILVLAFVPNPLFDMAGITAGALKLPLWRFLLWTSIGKIFKMLVFAYGGASIIRGLESLF